MNETESLILDYLEHVVNEHKAYFFNADNQIEDHRAEYSIALQIQSVIHDIIFRDVAEDDE